MDRLLFWDNKFFGVNHRSEEKARIQAMRFQDIEAIIDVLDDAYDEGGRSFMCTTDDRIALICEHILANPLRYREFKFMPCMPYAHKYANAVTEEGLLGALKRFMPEEGVFNASLQAGVALASKDIEGIITLLVDTEMKMFSGLNTPVVFLQNVVVDLLLGLGFKEGLLIFARHVRRRYGAEPGFISMNLPMLLDTLDVLGIDNPIVCSNINKIGFRTPSGLAAYRRALVGRRCRAIAMPVFASGAIAPRAAIEWVCAQPNIAAIVFGASSRANIRQTRELVQHGWPEPIAAGCLEAAL